RNWSGQENRIARIEHGVKEPSPVILAEVLDDVTAEPDVKTLPRLQERQRIADVNTVVQLPQRVAVPLEDLDALDTDLPIASLEASVPEFEVLPDDDAPSSHATADVDHRA